MLRKEGRKPSGCEGRESHEILAEASLVFVLLLLFFVFLAVPCGMRDLSSRTRDRTCAPCSGSMVS